MFLSQNRKYCHENLWRVEKTCKVHFRGQFLDAKQQTTRCTTQQLLIYCLADFSTHRLSFLVLSFISSLRFWCNGIVTVSFEVHVKFSSRIMSHCTVNRLLTADKIRNSFFHNTCTLCASCSSRSTVVTNMWLTYCIQQQFIQSYINSLTIATAW